MGNSQNASRHTFAGLLRPSLTFCSPAQKRHFRDTQVIDFTSSDHSTMDSLTSDSHIASSDDDCTSGSSNSPGRGLHSDVDSDDDSISSYCSVDSDVEEGYLGSAETNVDHYSDVCDLECCSSGSYGGFKIAGHGGISIRLACYHCGFNCSGGRAGNDLFATAWAHPHFRGHKWCQKSE